MTDNNVIDTINKSPYLKFGLLSIVAILFGVLGIWIVPGPLSAFPAIVGNLGFGMGIWWLIDKYVLTDLDTIVEIKKGNIAFAILILSIAIIIAASISAT